MNTSRDVRLSIDWISTTSHKREANLAYASYPELNDWENWKSCTPRNGYTIGARHTTGVSSYANMNRTDMGTHSIYTSKSLKRIEQMNGTSGIDILKYHVENGHSIARVDIALDFINFGFDVQDFADSWRNGDCVTRLRSCNEVRGLDTDGHTLYIGSQKTRKKLIRIYNKGAEQELNVDWIRCELQLMGKPATNLGLLWIASDDSEQFLLKAIKEIVDFPMINGWNMVFSGVQPIKIGSQSNEKGDTRDWLLNQVIPSLARECVLDAEFWIQFSYMNELEVKRLKGVK